MDLYFYKDDGRSENGNGNGITGMPHYYSPTETTKIRASSWLINFLKEKITDSTILSVLNSVTAN